MHLEIYESGLPADLADFVKISALANASILVIPSSSLDEFDSQLINIPQAHDQIILGIFFSLQLDWPFLHVTVYENGKPYNLERTYGGPGQNAPSWAVNTSLDFLRRTLISSQNNHKETRNHD